MPPNHPRIPSDEDDLTVPSLALCVSAIYSPTSESWRLKSPALPQRHRWRFEMMMKKDKKLRGIYFSPTSPVNDSEVALENATGLVTSEKEVHIPRPGSANTPRALDVQTGISLPGVTQPELNHLVFSISISKHRPHLSDSAVSLSSPLSPLKTCLPGASLPNQTGLLSSFTQAHQTTSPLSDLPALELPPLFTSLAITDSNVGGQPIRYISTSFFPGSNKLKVGCCTFLNLAYGANVECGLRIEPRQRTDNLSPTSDTDQKDASGKASVLLQIVKTVVNARTGKPVWLLCADTDVSSAFTPEVQQELSARTGLDGSSHNLSNANGKKHADDPTIPNPPRSASYGTSAQPDPPSNPSKPNHHHVPFQTPTSIKQNEDGEKQKDLWLSLTHPLLLNPNSSGSITVPLPTPLTHPYPSTSAATPPHLDDLTSLFEEITFLHRTFFVIRMAPLASRSSSAAKSAIPSTIPWNPSPAEPRDNQKGKKRTRQRFSIPYFSSELYSRLQPSSSASSSASAAASASASALSPGTQICRIKIFKEIMALQLGHFVSRSSGGFSSEKGKSKAQGKTQGQAIWKTVQLPRGILTPDEVGNMDDEVGETGDEEMRDVGEEKKRAVYAVPMHDSALISLPLAREKKAEEVGTDGVDAEVRCWVCFLVDAGLAGLWD